MKLTDGQMSWEVGEDVDAAWEEPLEGNWCKECGDEISAGERECVPCQRFGQWCEHRIDAWKLGE